MVPFFNNYYAHTSLAARDIYLMQYGQQQCNPSYSFGPAVRNHYIVHYVYEGCGELQTGGRSYHIHAGQLFIIYPEQSAYYKADEKNPWLYRWLEFNGDFAEKFMNAAGFSAECPVIDDNGEGSVGAAVKRLTDAQQTSFEHAMSLLWQIFSEMTRGAMESKTNSLAQGYVKSAENYIISNVHKKITVEDIADFLKISRNHLSRIYKKERGITLQQYMLNTKLNTAAQYLQNTDLTVKEIAASVGWSDPLEFSKAFKKKFNQPPSKWRRKEFWLQSVKQWW